jgi:hypothetical protein
MSIVGRIRPPLALAFYRAEDGLLLDRMIRDLTQGPFSHVELVFADNLSPWRPPVCCSVSWRDGGRRFKRIDVDTHRWEVVPVDTGARHALDVERWCTRQPQGRFDVPLALGIRLPVIRRLLSWRTSAEFCGLALQSIGLLQGVKASSLNPNSLRRLLLERP